MNSDLSIHISKLDAAKRQLDTAIALFFHYGDIVSIHTLSAASYDILKALCETNGIKQYMVKNESWIREEKRAEFRQMINKAQNFFKHADKDPSGLLKFKPAITEFFLWDATHMYSQLTKEHPPLLLVYRIWMSCKYPDSILESYPVSSAQKADALASIQKLGLDPSDKAKFYSLLPLITEISLTFNPPVIK